MRGVGAAKNVIVVGGGVAGIACALRLAEAGVAATLLETRKKLGGRATSFQDSRTGLLIDNCQHVAMGCCTNYLDLCRRLGVMEKMRWIRETFWVEAGGRVSVMRAGRIPAPGHFLTSFLAVSFLSAKEKARVGLAMRAAMLAERGAWRDATFARWLEKHGQPRAAVEKFWSPVVVSACNLGVERVCAATALHVFQEGFLASADAAAVGVSAVPLVELYDAAGVAVERAGGRIRLGTGVERVWPQRVVTSAGEELRADAVVCAVPVERAVRIVAEEVRAGDARFAAMERMTHSPILGVHVEFDRAVMGLHSAVLVGRATQWLFRKDEAGRRIHAVISAADEWMGLDEEEITRRVVGDIEACFPAAPGVRSAAVVSSRAVKEKLATFAATPECEASRPGTTGSSGLILAGDYVRTGWPATMEGAARSGYMAAGAVLDRPAREMVARPMRVGACVRVLSKAARAGWS